MNTNEIQDFVDALEKLQNAYDHYRMIQEQEHAHLNRRGSIAEWNIMVREKLQAQQLAEMIEKLTVRPKDFVYPGSVDQSLWA